MNYDHYRTVILSTHSFTSDAVLTGVTEVHQSTYCGPLYLFSQPLVSPGAFSVLVIWPSLAIPLILDNQTKWTQYSNRNDKLYHPRYDNNSETDALLRD